MVAVTSSDERRRERCGRELRSSSLGRPSVRNRRAHSCIHPEPENLRLVVLLARLDDDGGERRDVDGVRKALGLEAHPSVRTEPSLALSSDTRKHLSTVELDGRLRRKDLNDPCGLRLA
jgi:hypothetical protein